MRLVNQQSFLALTLAAGSLSNLLCQKIAPATQTAAQKAKQQSPSQARSANEETLRARLSINPHDRSAHTALCALLEKKGDYRASVEERKYWLEENPSHYSEMISLWTTAEIHLDDPECAIEVFRKLLTNPAISREAATVAQHALGRLLVARRQYQEGIAFQRKAVEQNDWYAGDLANALLAAGQVQDAIAVLRKRVDACSGCDSAHMALGDALGKAGDFEGQETEYRAALTIARKERSSELSRINLLTWQLRMAEFLVRRADYIRAEKLADDLMRQKGFEFNARLLRIIIFERQGLREKVNHELEEAKKAIGHEQSAGSVSVRGKSESEEPPYSSLALWLSSEEEWGLVIRILEPSKVTLSALDHRLLGMAYIKCERAMEGVEEIERSFESPTMNDGRGHFYVGGLLRGAGLQKAAAEHYRKAYELDPENVTYRMDYEASRSAILR